MKKKITLMAALIMAAFSGAYAQLTVGANTAPGSTIDVRGSVAAQYRTIAASGPMAANDFYVAYTGGGAGTITLPQSGTGVAPLAANFKGRLYTIKNATAAQTLTVTPFAGETVDSRTSISVGAGQSVQLVSTGNTPAAWEILSFSSATATGCVPGYILASPNQSNLGYPADITSVTTNVANGITQSGGVFTLVAGNTYELQASLYGSGFDAGPPNPTNAFLQYQWVNASTNVALPGVLAQIIPVTATYNDGANPITTTIYTPTSSVTVKLRTVGGNCGANVYGYALIKQINDCAGGSGGGNATASNGLTATAGNVALGGTLTQNTEIATAGNNLALSGTGKLGLGLATATQPTSTLQVNGSVATAFTATNASLTLTDAHSMVKNTATAAGTVTFTLPAPAAANAGRQYTLMGAEVLSKSLTRVTITGGNKFRGYTFVNSLGTTGGAAFINLYPGQSTTVVSDGTNWQVTTAPQKITIYYEGNAATAYQVYDFEAFNQRSAGEVTAKFTLWTGNCADGNGGNYSEGLILNSATRFSSGGQNFGTTSTSASSSPFTTFNHTTGCQPHNLVLSGRILTINKVAGGNTYGWITIEPVWQIN